MEAYNMITLTIPFPPSVNHYWFQKGIRRFIGAKGKQFRLDVLRIWNSYYGPMHPTTIAYETERLRLHINVYQPDKRKRDLDNLLKAPLDALQHAGVYADDTQIDDLQIVRNEIDRINPRLEVSIWTI